MARTRNIKPGFFKNEGLAELGFPSMILFAGLWTLADREGRLEDRPKRIKAEVFPYHRVDIDDLLSRLDQHHFIERYELSGNRYITIPTWKQHQHPNKKEGPSIIPAPNKHGADTVPAPNGHQPNTPSAPLHLKPCTLGPDDPAHAPPLNPEPGTLPWLVTTLADRHPKKGDRTAVEHLLVDMLSPLIEQHQRARINLIDSRHVAWCDEWRGTDKKYIPKLSNWLRDGGWLDAPSNGDAPDPGPGVPHASEIGLDD